MSVYSQIEYPNCHGEDGHEERAVAGDVRPRRQVQWKKVTDVEFRADGAEWTRLPRVRENGQKAIVAKESTNVQDVVSSEALLRLEEEEKKRPRKTTAGVKASDRKQCKASKLEIDEAAVVGGWRGVRR